MIAGILRPLTVNTGAGSALLDKRLTISRRTTKDIYLDQRGRVTVRGDRLRRRDADGNRCCDSAATRG